MKKKIQFILAKIFPSILLVLLSFTQGVFFGFMNIFIFILVYSLIFYHFIMKENLFNIFAVVLSGIILDSINDIYLGLNSFIFLSIYAVTAFEIRYMKVRDFLTTYFFYSINIVLTAIFILIISIFVHTNFVSMIEFIIISLLIFPILYNSIKLYKIIAPKSYEKY